MPSVVAEKEELVFIQLPTVLPGTAGREADTLPTVAASKDDKSDKEQKKVSGTCG